MQPLREPATPLLDLSGPIPYTALQTAFDPFFPKSRRYYWKSNHVVDLSDGAIHTGGNIRHLGGAMSRVGNAETAHGRHDAPYLFTAEASWEDPATDEQNIGWAREALAAMQPFSHFSRRLVSDLSWVRRGKGSDAARLLRAELRPLVALKSEYDPGNLFRMNLNIPPRA